MKLIGPLTTTTQSYDGRRTLNNRGVILLIILVVATFVFHSPFLGMVLFLGILGGGILSAGLSVRDWRRHP